jgi:hypothetical protein
MGEKCNEGSSEVGRKDRKRNEATRKGDGTRCEIGTRKNKHPHG